VSALPAELEYLGGALAALVALGPEEIDESLDTSAIDTALRKRIEGLVPGAAVRRLREDRKLLGDWLVDNPEHPAHFVMAYMEPPELVEYLARPPERAPRAPRKPVAPRVRIHIEVPEGFQRADVKKSVVLLGSRCAFVIAATTSEAQAASREEWFQMPGTTASDVAFGGWRGFASRHLQRESYWLATPTHHVDIMIDWGRGEPDQQLVASVLTSLTVS
jgi:hypothetical protein